MKSKEIFLLSVVCAVQQHSVEVFFFFSSNGAVFSASLLPSGVGKRKLSEIIFLVRLQWVLKMNVLSLTSVRKVMSVAVSTSALSHSQLRNGESLSNSMFPWANSQRCNYELWKTWSMPECLTHLTVTFVMPLGEPFILGSGLHSLLKLFMLQCNLIDPVFVKLDFVSSKRSFISGKRVLYYNLTRGKTFWANSKVFYESLTD